MLNLLGKQLGNYHLKRLLGRGGFAEVYLGEHVHLSTLAAIKVLNTEFQPTELQRFREEARTLASLVHPHILRILDFGVEGTTPYLVMEYAPNGSLRARHLRGNPLSPAVVSSYLKQVADALQFAHDQKVIHRDIKPENMLLVRDNTVLLADFGIAIMDSSSDYQTGEIIGTVAYMAPEQLQGHSRRASDQYSLGIVVYEWLCGRRPFNGTFTQIASQHMFSPPPSLREFVPTISHEMEQVVLKSLAKEPQERFVDVQQFASAFEQACELATTFTQPSLLHNINQLDSPAVNKTETNFEITNPALYVPLEEDLATHQNRYSLRIFIAQIRGILWQITMFVRQNVILADTKYRELTIMPSQRQQQPSLVPSPTAEEPSVHPSPISHFPAMTFQREPPNDFFIMYHNNDRAWAEWIAWQLEEAGYSVILPDWDFRLGTDFDQELQQMTVQAKRIIAVLSPDYLNARSIQLKWTTTFRRNTNKQGVFLPIYIRECGSELRKPLQSIVHIDLVGKDESLAHDILIAGIRLERGKPVTPPAFPGKRNSRSLNEQPPFPAPPNELGTILIQQVVSQLEAVLTRREVYPVDAGTAFVQQMIPKIAEAFTRKDWPDVIRKIDLLIKRTPTNISPEIYRMQWQALLETDETLRAHEALDMALATTPDRSQRLTLLNDCINILATLGFWEEVVRYSKEALLLSPNNPESLTFQQIALTHIAEQKKTSRYEDPKSRVAEMTQRIPQQIGEQTIELDWATKVISAADLQSTPVDLTVRAPKHKKNIKVFFSYAHEDEPLRVEIDKQLSFLKRQGLITSWHDREIGAGVEWATEIDQQLSQSNIIILLISSDFIASEYCYSVEMKKALERHAAGEAFVIPVILRPVHWQQSPFNKLQALPVGAKPITSWSNRDEAFLDVAKGIQRAVERMAQGF